MGNQEIEKKLSFEDKENLDGIVKSELEKHPDVITDGDKFANIWAIFGLKDADLARILGIDENQMNDVFDTGIPEELRERLDRTFTYASILEREIRSYEEISKLLTTKTPILRKAPYSRYSPSRSPLDCMKQGEIDGLLLISERQFLKTHE
ncbi:MAG: hypothetical protein M1405_02615 [Patescibacteria group bacterium]|nr:hypothetical protein [Patescibacteria group bacterium]